MAIEAVVFDMDGVLIDSETVWHEVRAAFVRDHGGHWTEDDQKAVMGANSREWSEHIRDACGVALSAEEIYAGVVRALRAALRERLPMYPAAPEVVEALSAQYPLAVASSSPREIIEYVLDQAGLAGHFRALVSSDEVERAKPQPDVYIEACRRLGCRPPCSAAVEDSANGIRAAVNAGMAVVAIPNEAFPPPPEVVSSARLSLGSLRELRPEMIAALNTEECDA